MIARRWFTVCAVAFLVLLIHLGHGGKPNWWLTITCAAIVLGAAERAMSSLSFSSTGARPVDGSSCITVHGDRPAPSRPVQVEFFDQDAPPRSVAP